MIRTSGRGPDLPETKPGFACSNFLSCLSCLSMFPNAANRFNGTWSLLPIGHKGPLFHSRMIRPVVGGGGTALGQTGVSQRVQVGSQRSRPPDTPQRTIGTAPPGSAGVSPACYPLGCHSVSLRCRSPPLLPVEIAWARPKQSHGAVAVRSGSRRWVRLYQDLCGRDARAPGGLSPMTS